MGVQQSDIKKLIKINFKLHLRRLIYKQWLKGTEIKINWKDLVEIYKIIFFELACWLHMQLAAGEMHYC